jgi:ribosomal protein L37AE/L43A
MASLVGRAISDKQAVFKNHLIGLCGLRYLSRECLDREKQYRSMETKKAGKIICDACRQKMIKRVLVKKQ